MKLSERHSANSSSRACLDPIRSNKLQYKITRGFFMKRYKVIAIFVLIPILQLSAFNRQDFDKIVDFNTTLKDLSLSIKSSTEISISREKIYIIDGTVANVTPYKEYDFAVKEDDFLSPDGFIIKLKNSQDGLLAYVYGELSVKTQKDINDYNRTVENRSLVLKSLCQDLKKIMQAEAFFRAARSTKAVFSRFIQSYSEKKLEDDERVFINRLVLEELYPSDFKQFTLDIDVAISEWLGYEEVDSYRSVIRFSGYNCFGFFKRKASKVTTPGYIPVFSTIIAIVKAIKPIDLPDGTKEWLLEGIYVRNTK
jgi:hypothetical protein